ncbi:hypothetical protein EK0264_11025 [Epidermidibacterium keratini]|uniref:DUF732 domain-containing protein n=1 Tax=Epidermidibacterium keratini TaxID=1891644 RepID=A0A7L4YNW7_9ACTN|nr:hypothetical protein [Epidermidibacterium keratini]QHC00768.1 hypothetical protein EK0264_11025 [Epidermidibacterium keratini]
MKKFAAAALVVAPMMLLAGCSKPSQDELHKSLVDDAEAQGAPPEVATAFADCAAPKLYEELSASSLNTIVENGLGPDTKVSEDDKKAGDKIVADCVTEAGG